MLFAGHSFLHVFQPAADLDVAPVSQDELSKTKNTVKHSYVMSVLNTEKAGTAVML
jgi:hypothetical protein